MDVMRIVHVLTQKVSKRNHDAELLYNNYKIWAKKVKEPGISEFNRSSI
jgi:hypothetical protein